MSSAPQGPLCGIRVVEFVGIGPGPHCAMLLSDLGADVLRIDRPGGTGWPNPVVDRGRASIEVDIRTEAGRTACLKATDLADVVIEGFRPGVMERLGLGPDVLLARNPRLVFGRVTGWGQDGPLATTAGHDITYIAMTGALAAMGRPGEPAQPPLNLVGDFGGGSMLLAFGLLAALIERGQSGRGQVVDAAIVDGVTSLMTMFSGLLPSKSISLDRERNMLGGAAPFYRCYLCADGREVAVGPLEPAFYREFLERLGAPMSFLADQHRQDLWPQQAAALARIFKTKTAGDWQAVFEGGDGCVVPVLTLEEAQKAPHLRTRETYVNENGVAQAAPVPRFSRTQGRVQSPRSAHEMIDGWSLRPSVFT